MRIKWGYNDLFGAPERNQVAGVLGVGQNTAISHTLRPKSAVKKSSMFFGQM